MNTINFKVDSADIEEVVRRMIEEMNASLPAPPEDPEAADLRHKLVLINAKQFITIAEAARLLSCSRGHIDTLLGRAQERSTDYPIPFRDLDGRIVFDREELLAWSKQTKPKRRKNRRLRDVSA